MVSKEDLERMDEVFTSIIEKQVEFNKEQMKKKLAEMSDSEREAYLYGKWKKNKEEKKK